MTKDRLYKHYKGGVYKLLSLCVHTETEERLVAYEDDCGNVWVRPSEMFFGSVEVDGETVKRFTRI